MASEKKNKPAEPKTHEQHITEAIKTKRRRLDNELSMFHSVKDQEFRAYEYYLRNGPGIPTPDDAEAHLDRLGLRYKIKSPKQPKRTPVHRPAMSSQTADELFVLNGHAGFIGEGTLGEEEEAARLRIYARQRAAKAAIGPLGPDEDAARARMEKIEGKWRAEMRREELEVEREFQGVITPYYLPLLGRRRNGPANRNTRPSHLTAQLSSRENKPKEQETYNEKEEKKAKSGSKPTPLSAQLMADVAKARGNAAPSLSSSAECHPSSIISPPATPSRPVSSSVPQDHDHALEHRRSSSRSDVSIDVLRSSLKDPNQPKSPKRVQFSIDNTVVSPSTSPLARRPSGTESSTEANAAKKAERFEVVKGKREGKSSPNGPEDPSTTSTSCSNGPSLNGSLAGMPSFGSYFQSKQSSSHKPTISTSIPSSPSTLTASTLTASNTTDIDFDMLDNEDADVFSFDEDVGARTASAKAGNKAEDGEEDDLKEEDFGDEEEGDGGGGGDGASSMTLTGSSPHAGSLPIEIKMPMRRERRGDEG